MVTQIKSGGLTLLSLPSVAQSLPLLANAAPNKLYTGAARDMRTKATAKTGAVCPQSHFIVGLPNDSSDISQITFKFMMMLPNWRH